MDRCAICGRELVLGCEGKTICKAHTTFEQVYEAGASDMRERCALLVQDDSPTDSSRDWLADEIRALPLREEK